MTGVEDRPPRQDGVAERAVPEEALLPLRFHKYHVRRPQRRRQALQVAFPRRAFNNSVADAGALFDGFKVGRGLAGAVVRLQHLVQADHVRVHGEARVRDALQVVHVVAVAPRVDVVG